MAYKYTFQGYDKDKMARAIAVSAGISHKHAGEISKHIKHRSLDKARDILNDVLEMKTPIPFKRFKLNVGHKPGMAAGRFPQNAASTIIDLLDSVEANANSKGLSNDLFITHMSATKAHTFPRGGRIPGSPKSTHVEIVVEEKKVEKKKYVSKKKAEEKPKKVEKKEEPKKEEKKPEPKVEEKKESPKEEKVEDKKE